MLLTYYENEADHSPRLILKEVEVINDHLRGGSEAAYIPISKTIAIKMYKDKDKDKARIALKCQQEAFEHNIGPDILSKLKGFIFTPRVAKEEYYVYTYTNESCMGYGYYTQIVDTIGVYERMSADEETDLLALLEKIKNLSYVPQDIRANNLGYIEDNLVMIDFGFLTTQVE